MDTPGNSCLLMRLPGDMKRKIEKLVQEKQLENKQHPIAVPKNIATELPQGYIKSNTWNKFGPANWHYIWNRTIPGQIALYRVCKSGDLMCLDLHESLIFLSTKSPDQVKHKSMARIIPMIYWLLATPHNQAVYYLFLS